MRMPLLMGAAMGAMILWMAHGMATGDGGPGGRALAVFIAAHVALACVIGFAALFASRLSPRLRQFTDRLHRPSLRHVAAMLGAALLSAGALHLFIHGGFA